MKNSIMRQFSTSKISREKSWRMKRNKLKKTCLEIDIPIITTEGVLLIEKEKDRR